MLRARNRHQLGVRAGSQMLPEVLGVGQMCPVSMEEKPGIVDKGCFLLHSEAPDTFRKKSLLTLA